MENWKIKMGEHFPKLDKITEGVYMTTTNDKYLSDYIDELPENCLFNKGKTGCGGTTLAIQSADSYVIAVPFKKLIQNKCEKYEDIIAVTGEVSEEELLSKISQKINNSLYKYNKNWKVTIMTTYDSLYKVNKVLNNLEVINEFRLLVDEIHILFNNYKLRGKAKASIIASKSLYKSFCFMTATTIDGYTPSWLEGVPTVKIYWNMMSEKASEIKYVKTNSVIDWTCQKIADSFTILYKENKKIFQKLESNLYFFVNSVKVINAICQKMEIAPEYVRCIYGENNTECLYPNQKASDEPKPINFITSTAFEGCDFFDENAEVFVLVSGIRANTIIDLDSTLVQINGRIRDVSKNSTTLVVDTIYMEDFCQKLERDYEDEKKICDFYNTLKSKKDIFDFDKSRYCVVEDGEAHIDEDAYLYDVYKVNMLKKYEQKAYDKQEVKPAKDYNKEINEKTGKDFFKKLEEYKEATTFEKSLMLLADPFLSEVVNKIGVDKAITLKTKQKIKICLNWCGEKDLQYNIAKTLDLKEGQFYSNETIKNRLKSIKNVIGSIPSNCVLHMHDFYGVRKAKRTNKNGYIVEFRRFQ